LANNFKEDYQLLLLDDRADWNTARDSYRRMIKTWHPDRYAQRPRERAHAQERFIELTGAYNRLRTFQRQNKRMPFQPLPGSVRHDTKIHAANTLTGTLHSGLRSEHKQSLFSPSLTNKLRWAIPACLLILSTFGLFLWLDRNDKLRNIQEAKDVLRNTEPSEYMPSARDVKRNNNRGVFVEGEQPNKLGDQLMRDVFRH